MFSIRKCFFTAFIEDWRAVLVEILACGAENTDCFYRGEKWMKKLEWAEITLIVRIDSYPQAHSLQTKVLQGQIFFFYEVDSYF